jgi:hypothetical protein
MNLPILQGKLDDDRINEIKNLLSKLFMDEESEIGSSQRLMKPQKVQNR